MSEGGIMRYVIALLIGLICIGLLYRVAEPEMITAYLEIGGLLTACLLLVGFGIYEKHRY